VCVLLLLLLASCEILRDNGGERIPTNILPESLADSIKLGGFSNCYIGKTLMYLEKYDAYRVA